MKSLLIIQTTAPYNCQQAELGLDVLTSSTTVFESVNVLFQNKGLRQLLTDQAPQQHKRFTDLYKALELYDINQIYVNQCDMKAHKFSRQDFIVNTVPLADIEIAQLIKKHDLVWVF